LLSSAEIDRHYSGDSHHALERWGVSHYDTVVSNTPWHIRNVRTLIYAAVALTIVSIGLYSFLMSPDAVQAWVSAREFYGLGALTLLLASMLIGPLIFVLPWLPMRAHLALGRRALGVSAFSLAVVHAVSYLGPTIDWNWRTLYTPGTLWMAGLLLGIPLIATMGTLAFTSRDQVVRRLGPKRWKKLHKAVYLLLPGTLLHAIFLGADFGVNHGPDVKTDTDAGCLVSTLIASAVWALLFVLRKRHLRIKLAVKSLI
jgi:DMSO/TMAO reductase YedYZ heme-binding membrane subunit